MLDPIVSLVTGINAEIIGKLFLVVFILGASIVGLTFMFGNREHALGAAKALLIGGAIVLGAPKIAAAIQGIVK